MSLVRQNPSGAASAVAWMIVGHLFAWLFALPATLVGFGAGILGLVVALYVAIRDRERLAVGVSIGLLAFGISLLAIQATVLDGFPYNQEVALRQALIAIALGVLSGAVLASHRRSRRNG